jgi:hypothetical protein
LSSLTVKLGVFSLWNGQQPFASPPLRVSFTDLPISADSVVRDAQRPAIQRDNATKPVKRDLFAGRRKVAGDRQAVFENRVHHCAVHRPIPPLA